MRRYPHRIGLYARTIAKQLKSDKEQLGRSDQLYRRHFITMLAALECTNENDAVDSSVERWRLGHEAVSGLLSLQVEGDLEIIRSVADKFSVCDESRLHALPRLGSPDAPYIVSLPADELRAQLIAGDAALPVAQILPLPAHLPADVAAVLRSAAAMDTAIYSYFVNNDGGALLAMIEALYTLSGEDSEGSREREMQFTALHFALARLAIEHDDVHQMLVRHSPLLATGKRSAGVAERLLVSVDELRATDDKLLPLPPSANAVHSEEKHKFTRYVFFPMRGSARPLHSLAWSLGGTPWSTKREEELPRLNEISSRLELHDLDKATEWMNERFTLIEDKRAQGEDVRELVSEMIDVGVVLLLHVVMAAPEAYANDDEYILPTGVHPAYSAGLWGALARTFDVAHREELEAAFLDAEAANDVRSQPDNLVSVALWQAALDYLPTDVTGDARHRRQLMEELVIRLSNSRSVAIGLASHAIALGSKIALACRAQMLAAMEEKEAALADLDVFLAQEGSEEDGEQLAHIQKTMQELRERIESDL